MDTSKILHKIALKLIEVTTRQDNIPFDRGDLRKSINETGIAEEGRDVVVIGSNLEYARAVHDGRPALVIRPKKAKMLAWWKNRQKGDAYKPFPTGKAFHDAILAGEIGIAKEVHQPARPANPYFARAVKTMADEGFDFLADDLREEVIRELERELRKLR
jgi:hypothetical protein